MDFKGPVGKEFYFLVVVNENRGYLEVAIVKPTVGTLITELCYSIDAL